MVTLSCQKEQQASCPNYALFIPNTFTPNGSGLNGTFGPKGYGIVSFEMWIFDGNGAQIYHCISLNNPWNGAVNGTGNVCSQGAYTYKINSSDPCSNSHTYTGTVILEK